MSAWEGSQSQCDICDGVMGHKVSCPRARSKPADTPHAKYARSAPPRFRYQGRIYELTVMARTPNGPCTLVSVDDPEDVITTRAFALDDPRFFVRA